MSIEIDLPDSVARLFEEEGRDINTVVKEAALSGLHWRGIISSSELQDALGCSPEALGAFMQRHKLIPGPARGGEQTSGENKAPPGPG